MLTRDPSTPPSSRPGAPPPRGIARVVHRAAAVAARWPRTVIGLWVLLIAACLVAGGMTGTRMISDQDDAAIGQSGRADQIIANAGLGDRPSEAVLVRSGDLGTTNTVARQIHSRLADLPQVLEVQSPLAPGGSIDELRTASGNAVLLNVVLRGSPDEAGTTSAPVERAVSAVRAAYPGVTVAQAGAGSVENAIDEMVASDLKKAELISVPITLLILVLVFGAFVAATVPLVLGITAVAGAMGALGVVSQVVPSGESTGALVVLIGLAVGVDYSLFYVRREREERRRGLGPDAALAAASASVGRAILVSGVTVMVSLAGLLLTGVPEFASMGVGTMLVVAIALIGSLTVLPAMLTVLGDRVDAGRIRLPGSKRRARRPARTPRRTAWAVIADRVTGAPRLALGAAVAVLLALAVPLTQMTLGDSGLSSLPKGIPAIDATAEIEQAFPGSPETAELVVTGSGLDAPAARSGLAALGARAATISGGQGQLPVEVSKDGRAAVIDVPMPARDSSASNAVVRQLRAELPALTPDLVPGADRTLVTGMAAGSLDFATTVKRAIPVVGGFVLGLALLLLLLAFRSPRLAFTVIGLNLLSVAAAFGVLTVVFQNTWAEELLGFTSSGSIVTWMPLISFVILFGLSMDYSILVLERIREARRAGRSPREAAAEGVTATASTVTGAAMVMVAVFAIFATLRMLEMKQLGVGLAAAILIDATIVRAFALPAAVTLLGEKAFPVQQSASEPAPTCDDGVMATSRLMEAGVDA